MFCKVRYGGRKFRMFVRVIFETRFGSKTDRRIAGLHEERTNVATVWAGKVLAHFRDDARKAIFDIPPQFRLFANKFPVPTNIRKSVCKIIAGDCGNYAADKADSE